MAGRAKRSSRQGRRLSCHRGGHEAHSQPSFDEGGGMKRTPMKRGTRPLQAKSRQRQRDDKARKVLVIEYLNQNPICEMCQSSVAVDVDEIIGRGVLPGAQMRPELFQGLCRPCHNWKHANPDWSYRHGWSAHEWQLTDIEGIKAKRIYCEIDCSLDHMEA